MANSTRIFTELVGRLFQLQYTTSVGLCRFQFGRFNIRLIALNRHQGGFARDSLTHLFYLEESVRKTWRLPAIPSG